MSASPLKRRAALATLDANAMTTTTPTSTTTSPIKTTLQQHAAADDVTCPSSASKATTAAPSFPSLSGTKRPNLHQQQQHHSPSTSATTSFKKSRLDSSHPAENTQPVPSSTQDSRSRTHSPDTSSVFDSSCAAEDASWSTAATEPDMLYSAASRRRVVALTREQAREVSHRPPFWSFMRHLSKPEKKEKKKEREGKQMIQKRNCTNHCPTES